jgi:hypothetical protein
MANRDGPEIYVSDRAAVMFFYFTYLMACRFRWLILRSCFVLPRPPVDAEDCQQVI